MKITVLSAENQMGWDCLDYRMGQAICQMVGRTYASVGFMRRTAARLSESYPTVVYTDGVRRYQYDGSPQGIPGRHVQVITDMGPYA